MESGTLYDHSALAQSGLAMQRYERLRGRSSEYRFDNRFASEVFYYNDDSHAAYINSPYPWVEEPVWSAVIPVALEAEPFENVERTIHAIKNSCESGAGLCETSLWTNTPTPIGRFGDDGYLDSDIPLIHFVKNSHLGLSDRWFRKMIAFGTAPRKLPASIEGDDYVDATSMNIECARLRSSLTEPVRVHEVFEMVECQNALQVKRNGKNMALKPEQWRNIGAMIGACALAA